METFRELLVLRQSKFGRTRMFMKMILTTPTHGCPDGKSVMMNIKKLLKCKEKEKQCNLMENNDLFIINRIKEQKLKELTEAAAVAVSTMPTQHQQNLMNVMAKLGAGNLEFH